MMMVDNDRIVGALVGLACGDAVGTTLEFEVRGTFDPISDMVGGGPFGLSKGQWTDDTSMALCLGASLLEQRGFDASDQMKKYCDWFENGYLSSTGECFDIGNTVGNALISFQSTGDPYSGSTDRFSSGNGSIMRMAPIPIFYYQDLAACVHYAAESSRTTHGSVLCIDACRLFSLLIHRAFTAKEKMDVFKGISHDYCVELEPLIDRSFVKLTYDQIEGSGYVIDSLISALWCFVHGDDFRSSILLAANIGNDADTTAAICGQIAGAYYGYESIPKDWRESITNAAEIKQMASDLYRVGMSS